MQTLSINIQDDFIVEFMRYIEKFKDKVEIHKDLNLEYDPYFYERKEKLQKLRDEIQSGKMELHRWDEFESEMEALEKKLELKYAD